MVRLRDYPRLIRTNRNFRLLWIAQIVSEIGDWFYAVAIYSLLLNYTGKAQSIAIAFVLQVLPQFFMAPAAGVLNDRLSRRRVMMFADWTRAGIVLCMLLVRGPQMVWLLYVLLFLETLMWALFEPGRSAVIPNIVAEDDVVIANALTTSSSATMFGITARSEEHTSELQSPDHLVCRLLLEKKKKIKTHREAVLNRNTLTATIDRETD